MTALRLLFGVGYVLMAALGGLGLLSLTQADPDADLDVIIFAGSFSAMIGVVGLAMILFIPLFARFRPGPVLGTAPSGASAVFFRRSSFLTVVSVLFTAFLAGWSGLLAIVLFEHEHEIWASLFVALALVMLWPVAVVPTGRIKPGGLWLTQAGLEYRKDAVSWTLPWSDLRHVERNRDVVPVWVLPDTAGLSRAAIEPLGLVLDLHARLEVRRTVRWIWNREYRMPEWMACVDCFDLAGGRGAIAEMIEHHLAYSWSRQRLGAEWSLPRRADSRSWR